MPELDELSIKQLGLISIKGIDKLFPNLAVLDLSKNRIFSVEAIEELHKLDSLAEVSFNDNPVCVHKHLKDMV
jgi:Leucine-rich repeat (LRR) protein